MILPPEAAKALGTGGELVIGKDVNGNTITGPDDIGLGNGVFQNTYNQAKGNLAKQQQNAAIIGDSLNVFNDTNASEYQKIQALGALVLAASGIALAGLEAAGLVAAGTVIATVPVVGIFIAAAVAVVALIAVGVEAIFGKARGEAIHVDTALQQALETIPPAMAFNGLTVTPQGIRCAYLVAKAVNVKIKNTGYSTASNGLSISAEVTSPSVDQEIGGWLLTLSQILGNDRGRADLMYETVSRALANPRWKLPRLAELDAMDGTVSGPRRFGTTYEEMATKWENKFPSVTQYGAQTNYFGGQKGWQAKAPAAYLALYAAIAVEQGFQDPASFAYMATYQLLIVRGWVYKASNTPIPQEELACQGFLLDLLSQAPITRKSTRLVDIAGKKTLVIGSLLVRDLAFYVNYYLEQAKSGAIANGVRTPFIPLGTVNSRTTIQVSGMWPVLEPGNYLLEAQKSLLSGDQISQLLNQSGIATQMLPPRPGVHRFFATIRQPIDLHQVASVRWTLMQKLPSPR